MQVIVARYEVWDWLLGSKTRVGEYTSRVEALKILHSVRAYYHEWCGFDLDTVDLHVFLVIEERSPTGEELDD